jgi:tripartite-type tricarboxylate transporter receptor subunit TctC
MTLKLLIAHPLPAIDVARWTIWESDMAVDRLRVARTLGLTLMACVASVLPAIGEAAAQSTYPDKPIRLIVGFAPGGPADFAARVLGDELAKTLGTAIVVENVVGAGGNIATDRVAKAAPDGYTLLMATSGMIVINPMLYNKLAFDTVRDLAPISKVSVQANILVVHGDLPAKSVQDLVTLARARPGELTFASGGIGTTQHLAGELFKSSAHVDIRHVPYSGIALAVPDLLTGRVTMAFANATVALPQVRDGKLRALAVTSLQRLQATPELPTVAESGFPGYDATSWYGLMAPAATPTPIIERLHRETAKVLTLPNVRKKFGEVDMQAVGDSPEEFGSAIRAEIPIWEQVVSSAGMKPAR